MDKLISSYVLMLLRVRVGATESNKIENGLEYIKGHINHYIHFNKYLFNKLGV